MKKLGLVLFAVALLGASAPAAGPSGHQGEGSELATARRVRGVITAIEPATLTIATAQRAVTGKIDPARTKVTINGRPATAADLKLTDDVRGELCLDDVWLAIATR